MNKKDYLKFAKDNFGEDISKYVLVCPMCDYEQSVEKLRDLAKQGKLFSKRYGSLNYEELKRLQPDIERECMSPDCNYVTYGLIPLGIEVNGGMYFPIKGMEVSN